MPLPHTNHQNPILQNAHKFSGMRVGQIKKNLRRCDVLYENESYAKIIDDLMDNSKPTTAKVKEVKVSGSSGVPVTDLLYLYKIGLGAGIPPMFKKLVRMDHTAPRRSTRRILKTPLPGILTHDEVPEGHTRPCMEVRGLQRRPRPPRRNGGK